MRTRMPRWIGVIILAIVVDVAGFAYTSYLSYKHPNYAFLFGCGFGGIASLSWIVPWIVLEGRGCCKKEMP